MPPTSGPAAARLPAPGRHGPGLDMETFFEVSLDLLCVRDRDFRFVRVNAAWEEALGYSVAELEGAPMLDFIHPDDRPASHGHMTRLEVEDEVRGFVNRYRRRDGAYRHLEWRARRVGDLVFGVARDVTERLAQEAAMVQARADAEAANRAKSDFLANMSHEIRTPLNGVVGVAAALARTELSAEQREMVQLIESSGVTLERLVSDVLDFSKIEAGRLEIEARPFDLRAELEGVLELFRLRAHEKGLAFVLDLDDSVSGGFVGDSLRLKQVLANLLSNAVKFTATGLVRVALAVDDPGPGGPARLRGEVEDTGIGFDAEFARRLFGRFSQADGAITRQFGGTGLGLSISRALVELMGGRMDASSEPGRGARFNFELPLPRCDLHPDAGGDGEGVDAGRLSGLRVLLAEDHPVNRRVVELILQPFGVVLSAVENGAEAVEAVLGGVFDLVLMDMQMPVMDGLAATRLIRESERLAGRPRLPIVMLSANAMGQHRLESGEAGADLHLAKPVTAEALVRTVLAALA